MKKIFTYLVLSLMPLVLSGCGLFIHKPPQDDVPAIPTGKTTVDFDQSLLQECPPLKAPESATDTDLQVFTASVLNAYVSCATLKSGENTEIKKALNIQ